MRNLERSLVGALLTITLVLAGCLAGPKAGVPDALDVAGPYLNATNCDAALFQERIRVREIDLATDANNPDRLAIGLIVSTPTTRQRAPHDWPFWNGIARSEDGGHTWRLRTEGGYAGDPQAATSRFGGNAFLTDPVVLFLSDGTLLYSGLAVGNGVEFYVQRYAPGSMTPESTSVVARGALTTAGGLHALVGTPAFTIYNDKQQLAEDPVSKAIFATWMWRTTGSGSDRAMPVLSRSVDGGRTWSPPAALFQDGHYDDPDGGFHLGAWPFVTRDGTVHVVWWDANAKKMMQVSSGDQGRTFSVARAISDVPTTFGQPGGVIQFGIPSIDTDRTGGPWDGSVYMTWEDRRNGDRDVFVLVSRDNATTWGEPARVNDDDVKNGKDQFLPQLVVEPTGAVSVLFMDRRHDDANASFLAYVGRSVDGGVTFANYPIASKASDPRLIENSRDNHPDPAGRTRLGDYNGIAYNRAGLVTVWQDGRDATEAVPFSGAYLCKAPTGPRLIGQPN